MSRWTAILSRWFGTQSLSAPLSSRRKYRVISKRRDRFIPQVHKLEDRILLSGLAFHWVNSGSGNFNVAANWRDQNNNPGVPGTGDTATISLTGITVTSSVNNTLQSLTSSATLEVSGGTFTVGGGSQVTHLLVDGGTFRPNGDTTTAAAADLSFGSVGGPGALVVSGTFKWSGGTMNGGGTTTVAAGGSLNLSGYISLDSSTLNNAGTAIWNGVQSFALANGAVFNNQQGASFDFQSQPANPTGTAGTAFNNSGTLMWSDSAGPITMQCPFHNTGVVQVNTSTLSLRSGGDASGGFTVATGATLDFGGGTFALGPSSSISGPGAVTFSGGGGLVAPGQVTEAGVYNVSGSTTFKPYGGTVTFTHAITNLGSTLTIAGASLALATGAAVSVPTLNLSFQNLYPGTLTGSDPITVTNTLNWGGGTLSGSGAVNVAAGALLNISGSVTLNGRTLNNAGSAVWSGVNQFTLKNGAVVNNQPGATFLIGNQPTFGASGTADTAFNNSGTLTVSAALVSLSFPFHNTGVVQVNSYLGLSSGDASGSFSVAAGATLSFGPFALGPASSVSGPGAVYFFGATEAGTYSVTGSTTVYTATFTHPVANFGSTLTIENMATFNTGAAVSVPTLNLEGNTTLTGSDPIAVTSALNWNGTLSGSGTVTVPAGAHLHISGAGTATTLDGRTLNNAGSAVLAGGFWLKNGAVVNNLAGASFDIQNQSDAQGTAGTAFNNAGTLTGSATYGTVGLALPFHNTGVVQVNTGTLVFGTDLTVDGSGVLLGQPGAAHLAVYGNLTGTTQNAALFAPQAAVQLYNPNGSSSSSNPELLEVMSQDLGNTPAGFAHNFGYQSLEVGDPNFGNYVRLVDNAHNSTGTGPEALYVNSLIVQPGTTFDLNGLHVYARSAQIDGTVVGGTINLLPDGGPILFNSSAPGTISPVGEVDDWTFFARAGQAPMVIVHTGSGGLPAPATPVLGYAQASLLDSGGHVLATASNSQTGADVTLPVVALPADGTYHIQVQAPASQPPATGNYLLTLINAPPLDAALTLGQPIHGKLETIFSVDHWHFTAVAGTQVQFHLQAADPGLQFDLTGPNGYAGFTNATADSTLLTLPATGTYTLTVHSDQKHNGGYSFQLTPGIIGLQLGTPYQNAINGSGQTQLFQVNVPAASPMQVVLHDNTNGDQNELYVKFGAPPTRADYDYRFPTPAAANQLVTIPMAAPGTWYVLLYTNLAPVPPSTYTLEATASNIALTSVLPQQNGTARDAVLYLTGAGFDRTTTVDLVAAGGTVYHAGGVQVNSPTQLSATFAAGTVPPAVYSVRATAGNGDTATLAQAFTVIPGAGQGVLTTQIVAPAAIGRHKPATIYVQYSNTGSAPLPAPLLVVNAFQNGGIQGALLTLDASRISSGFWTSANPDGYSQSVQFLASGATPGVLEPGESAVVPVYYGGWLISQYTYSPVFFQVGAIQPDNTAAIDWSGLRDSLRPAGINSDAWNALYPNLVAQMGSTWGGYVSRLDADAQYLAGLGENVNDLGKLFGFEIQQANGLPIMANPAANVDAVVQAPGLPLVFSRVFANSIVGRYQLGPLGRGWVMTGGFQRALAALADGSIVIAEGDGQERRFQPDQRGGYFDQPGDHATLTNLAGGRYTLQELNGQLTAFNLDGTVNYVQDTNGNRITAGYSNGLLTSLTHSSGQLLQIGYNAAGRITTVTDPASGRITHFGYDASNEHLLTVTTYDNRTTIYSYSVGDGAVTEHALLSVTHPAGTHDFFGYDGQGRLTDVHHDGGAEQTTFAYGPIGNVAATDAAGTTTYFFDQHGLMVKVDDPLHRDVSYGFDANFNLTKVTDPAGQSTTFAYDPNGNLVASTDALGHSIGFSYTQPFDRLASATDANGNVTRYAYDPAGNLSSTTYADNSIDQFGYDASGNPISLTNRRGHVIQDTYDSSGRVLTQTLSDGSQITYHYDSRGNLTTATDASGTTTLTYDSTDRLMQITYPGGRFLHYSYDAVGRRVQMVDQDGFTVNYSYDTLGRLASLNDAQGKALVTYSYDAVGRLSRKDMGNGTFTTYQYDAASELLQVVNHAQDGSVNSRFDSTYDNLGRRATTTTLDGQWTYTYDAVGQLTHAVFTSNNPATIPNQDLQYLYDAAGNRISTTINGVTTAYVTNQLNQIVSIGSAKLGYDADGNLISQTGASGTATFSYDDLDRLTGVNAANGETWSYGYDALGHAAALTHNGQKMSYLVDPFGLGDVVGQYGNSGAPIARYVYGLGLAARSDAAGVTSYYDFDASGSTAGITDPTSHYVDSYSYLPFGEGLTAHTTVANPFTFAGQFGVMSADNGLDFMRARSYSATQGRFTSMDPLGFMGGSLDVYLYSNSNPISFVDPSGLTPIPSWLSNPRETPHPPEKGPPNTDSSTDWEDGSKQHISTDSQGNIITDVQTKKGDGEDTGRSISTDPASGYQTDLSEDKGTSGGSSDGNGDGGGGGSAGGGGDGGSGGSGGGGSGGGGGGGGGGGRGRGLGPTHHFDPFPDPDPPDPVPPPGVAPPGGPGSMAPPAAPTDPNDKIGPTGFGTQGFVSAGQVFPYRVDFENEASATAPAQRVVVTDQLDANLDWNSFQLTGVGFGDNNIQVPARRQHFQTTVPMTYNGHSFNVEIELGLNAQTGLVTASFQSIDPNTQLPPDILTGFLPPENGTGRGLGYFSYLVKPKTGLTTGAQIRNVAAVVFDDNPAITTDQVDPHDPSKGTDPTKEDLNAIDAGPPTSSIQPLPATENAPSFTVNWSGQDDAGGSGIASFDIFVSDNSGPFSPFLHGAIQTSATFAGMAGHTYSFYSVATDNVGNVQPTPSAAQATTTVVILPTSTVNPLPVTQTTASFTVSWTGTPGIGATSIASYDIFVSDNGGAFTAFITKTTQTSATFAGQAGHTYGLYSVATDNQGHVQATPSAAQATTTVVILPTSSVNLLPATQAAASFTVSWTGTPGTGATSIASYNVFVSDDGGPFTAFMTKTTQTSATFTGQAGHAYGFYSVATDNQGHVQATPSAAQAMTTVIVLHPNTFTAFVTALYHTVLQRAPDDSGLNGWVAALQSGVTRLQVAQGFWKSPEHCGIQVDSFYASILHRKADPAGRADWVNALLGGMNETAVEFLFLTSPEYTASHSTAALFVTGLYADLFRRPVDPAGQATWIPAAASPFGRMLVAAEILTSPEMVKRTVDSYYADLLHRPPDPAGEQKWMNLLQSEPAAASVVAEAFLASDEFFAKNG